MPDIKTMRTLIFERVLPILRNKTSIDVNWLIYMPDRISSSSKKEVNETILDIHDFKNAVQIINKVKPNIIYASPYPNLPDYALALAGRHLKIPVVGEIVNQFLIEDRLLKMIKINISSFFEDSVPTDTHEKQRAFMRRGRFWIYKYQFVLRTQLAIGMSYWKIVKDFFMLLNAHLLPWKKMNNPRFMIDFHFVESELLMKKLIDDGYDKSTLILTGNPLYDVLFQELQKLQPFTKKDNKTNILLLTHSMYEHGFWTKKQRDNVIQGIVKEISKHKDEMNLIIKIHPSSEILSEYQSLIKLIDPSIPIFQKGNVIDFLKTCDVVIVYSTSTGPIQALILKKPIIMINLNLKGDIMLESGLVQECRSVSNIIQSIRQVLHSNPATEQKIKAFVKDYLYKFDGLASERMSNSILKIIEDNDIRIHR